MVYAFSFNSSVCNQISNSSVALCLKSVGYCESLGEHSGSYYTALQASLFAIGGVLIFKGISHGVVVIKLLSCDNNGTPRIQDYQSLRSEGGFFDAIEEPQRFRNPRFSILRHLSASVDYVARASLPVISGLVVNGLSNVSCWSAQDCIGAQSYFSGGCILAMKFFVQSIDNVIGVPEH